MKLANQHIQQIKKTKKKPA